MKGETIMLTSRPGRARLALIAACCAGLLFAWLAPGQARANDCAINNTFQLGTTNTCTLTTFLQGTAPFALWTQSSTTGATGLFGYASAATGGGRGVLGQTDSTSGSTYGVYGYLSAIAPGTPSAGVYGQSNGASVNGYGVFGHHSQMLGSAPGVFGETNSTSANAVGVRGVVRPITTGSYSAGVEGYNNGSNFGGFGVYGHHSGQGIGVYGEALNGFAVSGYSPNNWSGYFQGSVNVVGTLTKSAGAFRIDNPIDPAHSYLQHSFVESPDMKNVYDGNVTTNGKGFATVKLPAYFQALNRDFRYQLTTLGERGWDAKAGVWKKIKNNTFTIRTNKPNVEVSWQVTGIRHDAYANAHRIETVVAKEGSAAGKYVHPELYGKPLSKSVVVLPGMTPRTRPAFNAPSQSTKK